MNYRTLDEPKAFLILKTINDFLMDVSIKVFRTPNPNVILIGRLTFNFRENWNEILFPTFKMLRSNLSSTSCSVSVTQPTTFSALFNATMIRRKLLLKATVVKAFWFLLKNVKPFFLDRKWELSHCLARVCWEKSFVLLLKFLHFFRRSSDF